MRVFITGATGTVGRHVVSPLLDSGVDVRALTRNPEAANLPDGAEVIEGDLEQPGVWASALQGADALYLIAAGEQTADVLERARAGDITRIVTLSSASAGFDDNPGGNFHREFELQVEESGLEWTHIRPGMFATNLLDWADQIKRNRKVRAPYDAARQAPVHEKDVAGVVAAALHDRKHVGAVYTLSGPDSLTKSEQIAAIAAALDEPVLFDEVSPEVWRQENSDHMPDDVIDWLLGYWASALATSEPVLPDVETVLGRPATSLSQWALDHRDEFA